MTPPSVGFADTSPTGGGFGFHRPPTPYKNGA